MHQDTLALERHGELDFEDALVAVLGWVGRKARVELGSCRALADIAAFQALILDRVEEILEEDRSFAGEEYGLVFRGANGAIVAGVTFGTEIFEGGFNDPGYELCLYLAGVRLLIMRP